MNMVAMIGRMTKDPELKNTQEGSAYMRFSLAVDSGKDETSFIPCVAFGKTAEFISKYFRKGQKMGVTGRIKTGKYVRQDGSNAYTMDVIAERVDFASDKQTGEAAGEDEFMKIPEGIDEEMPFS